MSETIRIPVDEQSRTAEARRVIRHKSAQIGFDETTGEQIATVVTECCTNLLRQAGGGEILVSTTEENDRNRWADVEVLALDRGPGLNNLAQCMEDGFSTGGGADQGLGAIVRLSVESDFYSSPERGTAPLVRWTESKSVPGNTLLRAGAVNLPKPGQEVCGDSWALGQTSEECVLLVADGLGHGLEAKTASMEAVRIFHSNPATPPAELIELIHGALRSTRGAAVAVARIDRVKEIVTFAGVGNISAQIYAGAQTGPHMVSAHGTAGHQMQKVREFRYPGPRAACW